MEKIPETHLPSRILCLVLFLSIATGIAGWHVDGPSIERPLPDMVPYMALADGVGLNEVPAPYRYRVWTPWIAGRLPAPPDRVLDADRPLDRQRMHYRFAMLNAVGLALAAAALSLLASRLLHSERGGLVTGLMFLTSYFPLTVATLPMAEAWSYAFLAGSLWLLVERRHLALAVVFALGLTCKETTLLVIPAAVLLRSTRGERAGQALALLPATAAYLLWRTVWFPPDAALYSVASTQAWLTDLFVTGERLPGNAARALLAFHLFWIPALAAWWRRRGEPTPLVRWAWIVPIVLVVPFALALVPGRVWFFAFPFVLPLAVQGLSDWSGSGHDATAVQSMGRDRP